MHSKIKTHHIDRRAIVYVRQSTPGQVVKNPVSKERQLALRLVAINYGWAEENVVVVDCDQGISATWGYERKGFDYIVDEVANGHVGAIFGIEVARLSRVDSEFGGLIRLCMFTKTLTGDEKNIYDPNIPEDKFILNMRGVTSSLEIDAISDRLQGARRLLMAQGKHRFSLPTGYVYSNANTAVFDPRQEVQENIRLFFETFDRLGTAMAVVNFFKANNLKFPTKIRCGERQGEINWLQLTHHRALDVLHNPAYAGTYVAGQSETRRVINPHPPYKTEAKIVRLKREEWKNVIHDAYPAYISWEQFLRNEKVLEGNQNQAGEDKRGVPRAGVALLQGLAFCGKCNIRIYVFYPHSSKHQYYTCCRESIKFGTKHCQSFRGTLIDKAVEELFLQAFKPAGLELSLKVHQEIDQTRSHINSQWEARIRQAKADLKKIEARYDFAADHKDTRMAHRLNKECETKESEVIRLEREFSDSLLLHPPSLSEEDCRAILDLEHALPKVWHSEATTQEERKHLLRLVIEKVFLNRDDSTVNIKVEWKSGAYSELEVRLPAPSYSLKTDPEIINLIRTMGVDHTNQEIADHLNKAGYRNKHGGAFTRVRVKKLRYRYSFVEQLDGQRLETGERLYSMAATARLLGVRVTTIRAWRQKGVFESVQEESGGPWMIKLDPSRISELHKEINSKKSRAQEERSEELRREVLQAYENGAGTLKDVAEKFGVSISFISTARRLIRNTGSLAYKPRTQGSVTKEALQLIKRTLKKQPNIKIGPLLEIIQSKLSIKISKVVMSRTLTELGFPRRPVQPKTVYAVKKSS